MNRFIKTLILISIILLVLASSLLIFIWIIGNLLNMITFGIFDFGELQFLSVLLYIGLITYILEKY